MLTNAELLPCICTPEQLCSIAPPMTNFIKVCYDLASDEAPNYDLLRASLYKILD